MIGRLTGVLLEKNPPQILVDAQGVGYEVRVPLSTFYQVGEPGQDVALRIHTHVREESLQLFGFLTPLEQQVFGRRRVGDVPGFEIPERYFQFVRSGDAGPLAGIPLGLPHPSPQHFSRAADLLGH